jgi:hypothetical protein
MSWTRDEQVQVFEQFWRNYPEFCGVSSPIPLRSPSKKVFARCPTPDDSELGVCDAVLEVRFEVVGAGYVLSARCPLGHGPTELGPRSDPRRTNRRWTDAEKGRIVRGFCEEPGELYPRIKRLCRDRLTWSLPACPVDGARVVVAAFSAFVEFRCARCGQSLRIPQDFREGTGDYAESEWLHFWR